jgi:hypothetical protein
MAQWTLTTLRERLVKIGARIARHGRCSPRSCGASTGCEDRLCRWHDVKERRDGGFQGESYAPKVDERPWGGPDPPSEAIP